jgi:hypothetical protein
MPREIFATFAAADDDGVVPFRLGHCCFLENWKLNPGSGAATFGSLTSKSGLQTLPVA